MDQGPGRRSEKLQQLRAVVRIERVETISSGLALTVMRQDRLFDRCRPAVVQQPGDHSQAPKRRRAHLGTRRRALSDSIAQWTHVVKQEVGVRMEWPMPERRDLTRTGLHVRHMAG